MWHKSKPKVIRPHACFLWLHSTHASCMHIHMWNPQDWLKSPVLWPVNHLRINLNLWKKVKWNHIQDLCFLHTVFIQLTWVLLYVYVYHLFKMGIITYVWVKKNTKNTVNKDFCSTYVLCKNNPDSRLWVLETQALLYQAHSNDKPVLPHSVKIVFLTYK